MRRPLGRVPREIPPVSDERWFDWAWELRGKIDAQPRTWRELERIAYELDIGQELLRNLLGYMEGEGFAVSFQLAGCLVWCGCDKQCGDPSRRCSCAKGGAL